MATTTKPQRTTMEGAIWHANDILQKAISSHGAGLPRDVIENCHGVILISAVEVGAIFTNGVITVSFSNGIFAGVSLEGAKVTPNDKVNADFYGQPVTAQKILEGVVVKMPTDKVTLMDQVYAKLHILSLGETFDPDDEEHAKVEAAKLEADKAHDKVKDDPEIVHVDVKVEAAKERQAA